MIHLDDKSASVSFYETLGAQVSNGSRPRRRKGRTQFEAATDLIVRSPNGLLIKINEREQHSYT